MSSGVSPISVIRVERARRRRACARAFSRAMPTSSARTPVVETHSRRCPSPASHRGRSAPSFTCALGSMFPVSSDWMASPRSSMRGDRPRERRAWGAPSRAMSPARGGLSASCSASYIAGRCCSPSFTPPAARGSPARSSGRCDRPWPTRRVVIERPAEHGLEHLEERVPPVAGCAHQRAVYVPEDQLHRSCIHAHRGCGAVPGPNRRTLGGGRPQGRAGPHR